MDLTTLDLSQLSASVDRLALLEALRSEDAASWYRTHEKSAHALYHHLFQLGVSGLPDTCLKIRILNHSLCDLPERSPPEESKPIALS